MKGSIDYNLKRAFLSSNFYIAVILTMLLCMGGCVGEDVMNGDEILMFQLFGKMKSLKTEFDYNSFLLMMKTEMKWLVMFAPVVASTCFAPVFKEEQLSGMTRFVIPKIGRIKYSFSAWLACALTGGLSLVCGYSLFCLICRLFFWEPSQFPASDIENYISMYLTKNEDAAFIEALTKGKIFSVLAIRLLAVFLLGIFYSLLTLLVAVLANNKYVILCIPFCISYIWEQLGFKFAEYGMKTGRTKIFEFSIYSESSTLLKIDNMIGIYKKSFVFFACLSLVVSILFFVAMLRKEDCGA